MAPVRWPHAELAAWYERQLVDVRSLHEYRALPLRLSADDFVSHEERERLNQLPGAVEIRGRTCPIHYEVEEGTGGGQGVMRIVLHEKVARGLAAEELPEFDRPMRFTVTRGVRGSVKAASVDELHEALERPFTDDELTRDNQRGPSRGGGGSGKRDYGRGGARGGDRESGGRGGRGGRDGRGGGGGGPGGFGDDRRGGKGSNKPGSPSGRGKRRGRDR